MTPAGRSRGLRIGLIDMNNGVPNQAVRSFRSIIAAFAERARARNPGLSVTTAHVQPRNLGEVPPPDCDLYLSTGGPDSPVDGFKESWAPGVRTFFDRIVDGQQQRGSSAPSLFVVCYSFELAVMHFGVAAMLPRERKFGIMPVYPTEEGLASPLFAPFGDRLFVWEHRSWQAVELDEKRLSALGGRLLARESRDGHTKGRGLMAFRFTQGVEGTIFHPEADRPGVLNWIERPEQAKSVIETYGELVYRRMCKTIDDPTRLARTYALLLPGWMARTFNALALDRDWAPVDMPTYDAALGLDAFGRPAEATVSAESNS
jgi:homoserine O-succinyltransferase/O-acetyltransferase